MTSSYFALFNLEPRFGLSLEELELAFRAVAARVHPDRFAQADERQRRDSLLLATEANEAYRTLRKPLLRARHLLELRGVPTGESGAPLPPALLKEQFELREAFEDARRVPGSGLVMELEAQIKVRKEALQERLRQLLDVEQDNVAAAATVLNLMFFENLAGEIDKMLAAREE